MAIGTWEVPALCVCLYVCVICSRNWSGITVLGFLMFRFHKEPEETEIKGELLGRLRPATQKDTYKYTYISMCI